MRTIRIGLIALLAATLIPAAASPAAASCDPQKPQQTCEACHLEDISIDDSGNITIHWQCP